MTSTSRDEDEIALEYWRLAEELSLKNAALLVLGLDPERYQGLEKTASKPSGYVALRASLIAAALRGSLVVRINGYERSVYDPDGVHLGEEEISGTVDPSSSYVDVESLITWLKSRGHTTGFFFEGAGSVEPYLDPENERYAQKLAAVVSAWLAVEADQSTRTPKQKLVKWLRENAAQFGLSDQDGKPMEGAIEEVAKVANWSPQGGAPKTLEHAPPLPKPVPPFLKQPLPKAPTRRSFAADLEDDPPF